MNGEQNLNNPQHSACFIPRVNAQPFFHGSLFSGIGGFDLAAEWAGWQNAFHCEWNEFGQKILKHYWPKAISYGDITKTDFTIHRGTIDVLTGGFPCQPYSLAGKRKGKEDERHLWPEMLRAIREIAPSYIVGENVFGLLNWDGGLVFNEVQVDLENEGYEVQPCLLPACAKNAPHRRERIWFVAYNDSFRQQRNKELTKGLEHNGRREAFSEFDTHVSFGTVTDTECERQQRSRRAERQMRSETYGNWETSWTNPNGGWPTQSPICGGNDGVSYRLDRLKALGNAIVPQVAFEIFKAINLHAASYGWR
jgi:DNA (cytosine-5)-methyltransferase 1